MSVVELRVELPSYAHSFTIEVPTSATIVDVKHEIYRTCTGGPKVDGQRLIWRGRYLKDDERVEDIWKSPDEPRVLHLAVHPLAWSKGTPSVQARPVAQPSPTPTIPSPSTSSTPESTAHLSAASNGPSSSMSSASSISLARGGPHPLQYVMMKHSQALETLRGLPTTNVPASRNWGLRQMSVATVEKHGYIWPAILDENFPPQTPGGLIYDKQTLDGEDYLSLRQPPGTPTQAQRHALNVLTYTFSLLSLIQDVDPTPSPSVNTLQGVSVPLHVNELLQQLGLGHLDVAGADALPVEVQQVHHRPNPAPVLPPVREIALRPLVAPLMFLVLRTTLLLYFVPLSRNPSFAILLLTWTLYEIWRPIQNALLRIHRAAGDPRPQENVANPQQLQPVNNVAGEPAANEQPQLPRAPQNPDVAGLPFNFEEHLLNNTANQNIAHEEAVLNAIDGPVTEEPGFLHKTTTLLSLLITTANPAIWNRRRAVLRPREGRIRTEANLRNTLPNENDEASESRQHIRAELLAQHARRPRWVRGYIERVVAAEWVDDSD